MIAHLLRTLQRISQAQRKERTIVEVSSFIPGWLSQGTGRCTQTLDQITQLLQVDRLHENQVRLDRQAA